MCKSGGDGGAAEAQRAREAERQANIRLGAESINSAFSSFNDEFYNTRETDYLDYALPQLDEQYEDARSELILSLARNGRLQSSVRGDKIAELQKKYDLQRQAIQSQATGFANDARSSVANSRANLISQNNAIADPSQVGSLAASSAQALQASPTFSPLGTVFQNVTAGLATQADLERRGKAAVDTGIFTTKGPGSASIVGA